MALISKKKVLDLTRTNVLPPYEIEVSEDVAMTQAPGSPARSIQMDSPFVEENSLQVLSTFSTLFELSLGADLNNDLDKFSPSYQPLHFDDSSLTLPRRDLGSLEEIGVDLGEERSLRTVNAANDIRVALHQRFLELGEAIKKNQQMYKKIERQLFANPDRVHPSIVQAALSEVGRMLFENEQIQQVGEDFKEQIDEIMKEMSYELLAAVLDYSQQEGVNLGHKLPYNELDPEYKKLSEEFKEAKKQIETLGPRLNELQTENQRLKNSVMENDDMISEYNSSIARLKADKGLLELQIQNNTIRHQELEELTKELEGELGRTKAGVKSLEEANKNLTEENTKLKEGLSQDAATTEALERSEERYRALEKILRDCQAEVVALRQRIALLGIAPPPPPPLTALN
ncbi:hypothetical protein P167DRAFT_37448 [Morchella conica CCBAS932]|uniref:Uncharacterized protein n=1 Tax=Morchella conica CCBAS932 TaxID=1392247 RepID=A0A3N4K8C2_9PEZI|nr:hypothetical protein P167DRAFT_37448 [Morchella conica CCBAS932]